MEPLTYTTEELAHQVHASPLTLARWRYEHKGPSYRRIGRQVVYPSWMVREWIDSLPDPLHPLGSEADTSSDV